MYALLKLKELVFRLRVHDLDLLPVASLRLKDEGLEFIHLFYISLDIQGLTIHNKNSLFFDLMPCKLAHELAIVSRC